MTRGSKATPWLRCCPFCGAIEIDYGSFNDGYPRWAVRCLKCWAQISYSFRVEWNMTREEYERKDEETRLLTIAAWNRRDADEYYDED